MISSSYDFQAHQQHSQRRCCFSQTALLWFEVLPDMSPALPGSWQSLPGASGLVVGAPRLVARASSYSEGQQECPRRVWYSPEIDASKFTLHILSDTPRGFHWVQYILLMLGSKGDRIWRGTRLWWITHIAWIYEHSAWVCGTKFCESRNVCISYNKMMSIYSPVSRYAPPPLPPPPPPLLVAQSVSVIHVSPYNPHWLPLARLNCGGGENRIFAPQWLPSAFLSSLNQHLQVHLEFRSRTVCGLIDRMYIYRETQVHNTCQIVM